MGVITVTNIVGVPLMFRAWFTKDKIMKFYKSTEFFDFVYTNYKEISKYKIIISQYTGVNSKDGQQIYVGDIVYWDDFKDSPEIVIWTETEKSFVCDYPDGSPGSWLDDQCLIKGNIFENPIL